MLSDNTNRRVSTQENIVEVVEKGVKRRAAAKRKTSPKPQPRPVFEGQPCPLCGKGHIIKGKTAYGCSEWKNGCTFRQTFSVES